MGTVIATAVIHEVGADGNELLARRTRMIPIMIIAGTVCFVIFDPWLNAPVLSKLVVLKLAVIAAQLAGLGMLRAAATPPRMVQIGLICFAIGAVGGAVSGIITHDPFTTPLLCMAGALITAAVVPWGARPQSFAAAFAVAAAAATIVLVTGWPAAGYPVIALSFIAAISVYVAFELARQRTAEAAARVELQRHQAELAHVLRVGAMGEMAAQLAHELTQPLGAIANYAAGCRNRLQATPGAGADLVDAVDRIASEALRAGEIIRRIRGFVRNAPPNRTATDVNMLVRDVVSLISAEARASNVTIELALQEDLRAIAVDAVQIEQVLINVVRNGLESLRHSPEGNRVLGIATSHVPPRAVEIAVYDSGGGLGDADPDAVFEPFYTTKENGLGMGLAISRAIIEAHGGRLWVVPSLTRGVTFHFSLPR